MNRFEKLMTSVGNFVSTFTTAIPNFLTNYLKSTVQVGIPPEDREVTRVGWYFTTVSSQGARLLISMVGGCGLAYILTLIFWIFNIPYVTEHLWKLWAVLGFVLTLNIGWNEDKMTIPANHVGFLTFLGTRRSIYLKEGDYWWLGQRFFFGVSKQPLPKGKNVQEGDGEEQGFVFTGKRILQIWDNADSVKKNIHISLQAQEGSSVTTSLDVNTTTINPMKRARVTDASLRIANTTRAGLRKAAALIRDTDFNAAKEIITDLIVGDQVLVVFTLKRVDSYLAGTMVKDNSGSPISHRLDFEDIKEILQDPNVTEKDKKAAKDASIAAQIATFAKEVKANGNKTQVGVSMVKSDEEGGEDKLAVAILDVREKLAPILEEVGDTLDNLILSDAQLSDVVRIAGEKASSEGYQRTAQIMSAKTQQEAAAILSVDKDGKPTSDFAKALAATQDGNQGVSIVLVPEGDSLTRALVAGGKQIGGKK